MKVWGITDTGAVRQQNQDAYRIEIMGPDQILAMVCDGMGGARAGNIASQLAVRTFGDTVLDSLTAGGPPAGELLVQAAERANRVICERAGSDPDCLGMGTTLVAALTDGETCWVVNIGDSRAYLAGPDGIWKITRDHSVVEDLVQRGEITPDQARNHPQKNLITRALGADDQVQADIFQTPCIPESFLLLCSDGLSNVVTDQELLYEMIHGGEPESCCKRLLDMAMSRGAPDNVTAVLLQM